MLAFVLGSSAAYSQDTNGVGSWSPVPNNGWLNNGVDGIEAIHMIHLPTSQLFVWSLTDWENHTDTTYLTFSLDTFTLSELTTVSLGNFFCSGHTHLSDGSVFVAGGHESKWIDINYRNHNTAIIQVRLTRFRGSSSARLRMHSTNINGLFLDL